MIWIYDELREMKEKRLVRGKLGVECKQTLIALFMNLQT